PQQAAGLSIYAIVRVRSVSALLDGCFAQSIVVRAYWRNLLSLVRAWLTLVRMSEALAVQTDAVGMQVTWRTDRAHKSEAIRSKLHENSRHAELGVCPIQPSSKLQFRSLPT